jgi:plastocyanin
MAGRNITRLAITRLAITRLAIMRLGLNFATRVLVAALLALASIQSPARAQNAASLSITIKDHKFEPAELHAPPGKQIAIHVKNLNPTPSEFESSALHFEKVIPKGKEGVVYVRPLKPGRYKFYDDFHRATEGYLIVP